MKNNISVSICTSMSVLTIMYILQNILQLGGTIITVLSGIGGVVCGVGVSVLLLGVQNE